MVQGTLVTIYDMFVREEGILEDVHEQRGCMQFLCEDLW